MLHRLESIMDKYKLPWFRFGKSIENSSTAKEAIIAAELNWQVLEKPLMAGDYGEEVIACHDFKAIVRETDNRVLGIVGKSYVPFQNIDLFSFCDSLINRGHVKYHTAGSLKGGKYVWVLTELPGALLITNNDIIERYLLIANSHDGTFTLRIFFIPFRIKCLNILNFALQKLYKEGISIKHIGNLEDKLNRAREILKSATNYYDGFADIARKMVRKKVTEVNVNNFLKACFPSISESKGRIEDNQTYREIRDILDGNTGTKIKEIEGSLWELLNAVIEWVDHKPSIDKDEKKALENRLYSLWFGRRKSIKQRAFEKAMEILRN